MKVIVLLVSLIAFYQSSPVAPFRDVAPVVWAHENNTKFLKDYAVSTKDIKIYFKSQPNPSMIPIDLSNPQEVNDDGFSNEKDTVLIIHGWNNEFDSPICEEISEAILKVKDANIFIVDWSQIAKSPYDIATAAVPEVAKIVSKLINDLINDNGLDLDKTFIVGHSLGAHVAGLSGADLKGQVNHIVGLDPALPLFDLFDKDGRLDSSDAKFVQVIHTCAGLLGFNNSLGHVDYWPNGGSNQPGCGGNSDYGACSHGRSFEYYAESIVSSGFISRKCDNYNDFKNGLCDSEAISLMGEYNPDTKARGNYFLNTNSDSPFAQN